MKDGQYVRSIDRQIGERVAKYRLLASVSTQTAAERCGLSAEDYLERENGVRRFLAVELYVLASCFAVHFSSFVSGTSIA